MDGIGAFFPTVPQKIPQRIQIVRPISLANLAAENENESDDDFQVQIALSSRYPALFLQSMISFDPNLAPMDIALLKALEQRYQKVFKAAHLKNSIPSQPKALKAIESYPIKILISNPQYAAYFHI